MQQFFRFSSTQFYHSVDASSGAFHNILQEEDFFSASSFETVIDVRRCYLHIHAGELYGNRVEFFIRTNQTGDVLRYLFSVPMINSLCSVFCKFMIPVVEPTKSSLLYYFLTAFRVYQERASGVCCTAFSTSFALTTICLGHPPL